jgi:LmbE family N-acetylglucosaminyl deacetylase
MRQLSLQQSGARRGLNILCLGAHCDDIDIGCGGTLLTLLERHPGTHVNWVVFASTPQRERELRASARRLLRRAASARVTAHTFRDGFFPSQFAQIKEAFESLKQLPPPDLVFTHQRAEMHQDHRIIAELTWNTFRDNLILEYEIPKWDGGLTTPCVYVELGRALVEHKIRVLMSCYATQLTKRWFTADTFRALMRLRGIESGSASGWAEGFHASKILIG